jgi:N-acetylglucosamine kinase-like BadF-type ATPase
MKIFAGIDGGGTRTRLVLVGEDGLVLGHASGRSCNFTEHGISKTQTELTRLWNEAWSAAGVKPKQADAVFMGLGSILSQDEVKINCRIATEVGFAQADSIFADNDVWNAHAGRLGGRPGILLISGTGSACFGRNNRDASWRTGGWGHLLDERGSAHAVGHAALVAATRAADGRGKPTKLSSLVCDALGMRAITEIFYKVHCAGVARADVAALAPKVVDLAESDDPVARQILAEQIQGLVEMVVTVAGHLSEKSPELALTGGLIDNSQTFRKMFLERLASALPQFRLAEDGLAPVFGSVLLAIERSTGSAPSKLFLECLQRSSANLANLQ